VSKKVIQQMREFVRSGNRPSIFTVSDWACDLEQEEQSSGFPDTHTTFSMGDKVRKVRGSQWKGRVVGYYSTELTKEGYAVESDTEVGSVQIYPAAALERVERARLTDSVEGDLT
jgi:hypothetical protein